MNSFDIRELDGFDKKITPLLEVVFSNFLANLYDVYGGYDMATLLVRVTGLGLRKVCHDLRTRLSPPRGRTCCRTRALRSNPKAAFLEFQSTEYRVQRLHPVQKIPPPPSNTRLNVAVDVDEVLGQFLFALNKFCRDRYGMFHDMEDYHVYHFATVFFIILPILQYLDRFGNVAPIRQRISSTNSSNLLISIKFR